MKIIIATQNYNGTETKRAFIKEDEAKSHKFMKELTSLGWDDVQCIEVDSIMYNRLEIKTERNY